MSLKNISLLKTSSWKNLHVHYKKIKNKSIKKLFEEDANRFQNFSIHIDDIFIDYSKNIINKETIQILFELARECKLYDAMQKMFYGEIINITEQRSVLHTALRKSLKKSVYVNGKDIMQDINLILEKIKIFTEKLLSGQIRGYTEKSFTDVVNIGIGGSDLGPVMIVEALKYYKTHLKMHFVSNIDYTHITNVLKKLNPETTIFIISSKTFSTVETITNALTARQWFIKQVEEEKFFSKHFVAVSTNLAAAKEFGICTEYIFQFLDCISGRYSIWGAVGLSISLAIGFKRFEEVLNGAISIDKHFLNVSLEKNIPVILALLGIWYNNFFGFETHAIFPYEQYLHRFPAYIQQADMESNGKYIDRTGSKVNYQTGPIIWGDIGTNCQHSFYQLLHQGTKRSYCDFLAPINSLNPNYDHHKKLFSNFLAQTRALALGNNCDTTKKKFEKYDYTRCEGNRPSNSIIYKILTPKILGSLIAIYEHKIFVQGLIWNIYSFDQWGVELGKVFYREIFDVLEDDKAYKNLDISTNGIINHYRKMKI